MLKIASFTELSTNVKRLKNYETTYECLVVFSRKPKDRGLTYTRPLSAALPLLEIFDLENRS